MKDTLRCAFDRAVACCPSATAVDAPDGRLTFAELDAKSERLARYLARQPFAAIGILLAPSTAFYASLLACMKARVVAVPLDPAVPDPNLAAMSRDLDVKRFITDAAGAGRVEGFAEGIDSETAGDMASDAGRTTSEPGAHWPAQALHRILTSGSSGRRTIVTIGREAEVVHAREMGEAYGYRPGMRVANLGRHVSGAGVNGFWRVLLGGSGLIAFDVQHESFEQIYRRLQAGRPVGLQGMPTLLDALAAACEGRPRLDSVERLVLGGEVLSPAQLRRIAALLPARCLVTVNYSSTETMHVACYTAQMAEMLALPRIPIGRPLPSRRVTIVGLDDKPVAAGEVGEIVVASKHLALSIEGPQAMERYASDRDDPELRTYRTRDLGRINELGLLEHLGRIDRQLKINGVRIDPALIEAELESVPGVNRAVVLGVAEDGDRVRLVGCVQRGPQATDSVLRAALWQRLPASFVPGCFVDVEAFPIGPTGKTDVRALEAHCGSVLAAQVAPNGGAESPLRAALLAAWSKALRRPVSVDAGSFFDEGGDSLTAAVLVTALAEVGAHDLGTLWVSEHPTLDAQERALAGALRLPPSAAPSADVSAAPAAACAGPAAIDRDEALRRIGWV